MAKDKRGAEKGQKSITSFFGGGSKKVQSKPIKVDSETEDDSPFHADLDEATEPEPEPVADTTSDVDMQDEDTKTRSKAYAPDNSELPPIYEIPVIFSDLVKRVPQIKAVAEHLQGRKMRVATMCSGTESPLLALDLIRKSIVDHYGVTLDFEHVFSCEIEPFKQAYIERNFSPPLLFRDVCELGDSHATTAYGALAPVPGDVDILIAGTSCVDYSNLNNEKQDIDANGESGRTFRGMMSWVKNHRPPLVILENVCSAPWPRVVDYFKKSGYSADFLRVDTKQFYIPHTRTRVYLLAVNKAKSAHPEQWKDMINKIKRPASSTLDAFLLPSDDPRIHQAREKLVRESDVDGRAGRTDWGRCESRHQRARLEEQLGSKRPLTNWDDGGFCKMPDFAWNDWSHGQVERVWDLMDISLLRSAGKGVDPSYKTQVWNLSQNVDRTIGSNKVGICPCLTPSMIPYITNRGGPMVGIEALSMQGLPVDKLLLTRETEDQLADLAGNAMSTTVVGACILSALIVGKKLLKKGDDDQTYEAKNHITIVDNDGDVAMDVDRPLQDGDTSSVEEHISGEKKLEEKPLDLSATSERSLADLLVDAQKSVRLCDCEGRKGLTDRVLNRCKDCGSTSCVKCGGRPEHNPEPIDIVKNPRLLPATFERELKSTLPMSLRLSSVTQELLDGLRESSGAKVSDKRWASWSAVVLRAVKDELRFVEPKRQEIWAVTYQSSTAYAELLLYPHQPEWRFFAKPEESEPANSELRKLLESPIGRFVCSDGLLSGRWEFALPFTTTVSITIEGSDPVDAWEAKLGLQANDLKDKKVHSRLEISLSEADAKKFDRDISGVYMLLDKCGTANSALHKRVPTADDGNLPPIFMLLDPTRCGDPKDDSFVFSISKRRYEYGEARPILCQLDSKWRQSDVEGTQTVHCKIPSLWTHSEEVSLEPIHTRDAIYATPGDHFDINISADSCRSANALLVCRVPLSAQAGPEWPRGQWKEVDKVHERPTFKALAWLVERIKNVDDHFLDWQPVTDSAHVHANDESCERCAPSAPVLRWAQNKAKIVPMEDPVQAGEYERALKARPAPFVTQLKLDEDGVGTVRIGINIASLMHRALSRLPSAGRNEVAKLSWRLQTDFAPTAKLQLPTVRLLSNRSDPEHAQPPSFKTKLRPEQLRSLTWMLAREAKDAPPFIEEEISEAVLEPLGWRAEGRAERPIHVRGGVIADEVGYGKTAITLGLIDCNAKEVNKEFSKKGDIKGKIPVKATLVIVPPHLTRQWNSEVQKFTGKKFNVVVISTLANLNSLTIEQVQDADIVIVANNLFRSANYLQNLEALAAGGELPARGGRYFDARLSAIHESLSKQVDRLRDEGAAQVVEEIEKARTRETSYYVPTKRLKGKTYRNAVDAEEQTKKPEVSSENITPNKAKPRHGEVMEVLLPPPPKRSVLSSRSDASSAAEETNEDDLPRPKRRSAKKAIIMFSDDEEEQQAGTESADDDSRVKSKPRRLIKGGKAKRSGVASSASSDYEASSAEETEDDDDDNDDVVMSSDEESSHKRKGSKPKPKASVKSRLGNASKKSDTSEGETTGNDSAMDVDDEPAPIRKGAAKGKAKTSGSVKKRKSSPESDNDDRPAKKTRRDAKGPAKQKRREDKDPWKLKSVAVRRDWTQMQSPPLEIFHFARKVIDEFTYVPDEEVSYKMITNLTADRQWVLSGTPPLEDFAALKSMAAFLGVHLGVYDDQEGKVDKKGRTKLLKDRTAVEKFHSFREVHTWEWHAHRHELGQIFLDHFVRQNIAEIDEIVCTEKIERVVLPASERAIYLELEHHLRALEMTIKRGGKKSESDREKRLTEAIGKSQSADEALLKRCSHFDLDASEENAMKACEIIVKARTKQLESCKSELLKRLQQARQMEQKIGKTGEESLFQEHVRVCRSDGLGDKDATDIVCQLLKDAQIPELLGTVTNQHGETKSSAKNKNKSKGKDEVKISSAVKDLIWEHREKTHIIRAVTKELVARVRSLRFFTVVRDLQKQREEPPIIPCPGCDRDQVPLDEIAVLSSCGHTGCLTCVTRCAAEEVCVHKDQDGCHAPARLTNIVRGDTLGVDDEARDGRGKHYGLKLEKVIDLIKNRIPKSERVLIFVQFPDLTQKVEEALSAHKVKFLTIKGNANMMSKALEKFQKTSEERVLLLNVLDASASGANLTIANHAIFLSPLLTATQEAFDSRETQAIGRVRRYGQTKPVYVYRFLSTNTIDEDIYEKRVLKRRA